MFAPVSFLSHLSGTLPLSLTPFLFRDTNLICFFMQIVDLVFANSFGAIADCYIYLICFSDFLFLIVFRWEDCDLVLLLVWFFRWLFSVLLR